jgi:hypothetical protein
LLADYADFYLNVDHKYLGEDYRAQRLLNLNVWRNPGGLTAILQTINHFEREIVLGACARTREALRLVVGASPFTPASYFDFVALRQPCGLSRGKAKAVQYS